jgi:hypothetical protein
VKDESGMTPASRDDVTPPGAHVNRASEPSRIRVITNVC